MLFSLAFAGLPASAGEPASSPVTDTPRWWRGNLHTHTFWSSDGDAFPESIAQWYKDHGYNFLAFTDHGILLQGEQWKNFPNQQARTEYRKLFGDEWVQTRTNNHDGRIQVRLRTLEEFRPMFEEPQKFLLIMGNEISAGGHVVALNQDVLLVPDRAAPGGRYGSIRDVVNKVDACRASSGRSMFAILAHPNYTWAVSAEMMIDIETLRFFEVYNGHPRGNNDGDAHRASTDRMWDIVLASRLSNKNGKLLYGVAADDAHNYHGGSCGPGRGWVMVNSAQLTPEAILDALEQGDFYATTGVMLRKMSQSSGTIRVEIAPQEGVQYITEYVGTRRGVDLANTPTLGADGQKIPNATRTYSRSIGDVLFRSTNACSRYTFSGDELYVRVRITSSADHVDPVTAQSLGDKQRAWGQPMVLSEHRSPNNKE
ncbi:MAG: hypothetical protein PHW60_14865 [Kiritimatiellae bacterium]|nr:hypothetical protein [Kiritimatiellia bacterium]